MHQERPSPPPPALPGSCIPVLCSPAEAQHVLPLWRLGRHGATLSECAAPPPGRPPTALTCRAPPRPSPQLEALQAQLEAAEQERRELRHEVEQLRALGLQQVRPGPGLSGGQLREARATGGGAGSPMPALRRGVATAGTGGVRSRSLQPATAMGRQAEGACQTMPAAARFCCAGAGAHRRPDARRLLALPCLYQGACPQSCCCARCARCSRCVRCAGELPEAAGATTAVRLRRPTVIPVPAASLSAGS